MIFDPRTKPERGTYEIDRGRELAVGLEGLWLFDERGGTIGRNIADPRQTGVYLNRPGFHPAGMLTTGTSQTAAQGFNAGIVANFFTDFTVVAQCTPLAFNSGAAQFVAGRDHPTQRGWAVGFDASSGSTSALQLEVSGLPRLVSPPSVTLNRRYQLALRVQRGTWAVYLNGFFASSNAAGNLSITTPPELHFARRSYTNVNNPFQGLIEFGAMYSRALHPQELLQLAAEPYGMLRPIRRRTWFVPSTATGTLLLLRRRTLALAA